MCTDHDSIGPLANCLFNGCELHVIRDLWTVGRSFVKSNPWALPIGLLGVAVRIVRLGNYLVESVFARWWMSRYLEMRALRAANSAAGPVAEAA